jgi:hypothetical protein
MGIALEYAFVVAVAGGLVAICLAHFLESIEDEQMQDRPEALHGLRALEHSSLRMSATPYPGQITRRRPPSVE